MRLDFTFADGAVILNSDFTFVDGAVLVLFDVV